MAEQTHEEVMEQAEKKVRSILGHLVIRDTASINADEAIKQIFSILIDGKTIKELVKCWASGKLREKSNG